MPRSIGFIAAVLLALPLLANPRLQVAIEGPDTVGPNDQLTWNAIVENIGDEPAEDVHLWSMVLNSGCFEEAPIGTFQPGEKRTFPCTRPVFEFIYTLDIYVQASSAPADLTKHTTAYASKAVTVITPPDLFVFTNLYRPLGIPKLPFPFEVSYGNLAHTAATDTVITITTPTRVVHAPEFCTLEANGARCTIGTLARADYPSRFELTIEAPDASAATFPIGMAIRANEPDHHPSNDTFSRDAITYRTFFVTNTNDAGSGSLRAAVDGVNAECGDPWPCLIAFRVPADGARTIALQTPLPHLSAETLIIDGATQPQYFAGSSIALDGTNAGGGALAIDQLCGGGVRGMTIRNFAGAAISMAGANCTFASFPRRIEQNLLERNGRGIETSVGASIDANTIVGHERSGIFLNAGQQSVTRNVVRDNGASGIFVGSAASGTDITGNTIANNAHFGVAIALDAPNVSLHRNSISGNVQAGIDWGLDAVSNGPVPIPVITRVYPVEIGATVIEGTLDWSGSFSPEVELFVSDDGEGAQFLQSIHASGPFSVTVLQSLSGKYVTATATRAVYVGWLRPPSANGDTGWGYYTTTSEFSAPFKVQ
ncbi:MAG TPA: right-handed parallel beta-helix repeat-containing protein [Thermoanaerobaculia bacterium]|nr:right-handed parallel beta-helix repeat-containing protein [Thermoanaerobaculia bacterium]